MKKDNGNTVRVSISEKNEGVVDFIRNEIRAKKERQKAILLSIERSFIDKLRNTGKVSTQR